MTNEHSHPTPSSIRDDSICEPSLNPNKSSGDIVDRLREPKSGNPVDLACHLDDLCQDAAAEIERRDRLISAHQQQIIDGSAMLAAKDAEIERLRLGYRAIMEGLIAGRVGGDDVVWYDNIETLFDFCDVMINGNEPRQFHELKSLEDRALTAESAVAAAYENAAKIAEQVGNFGDYKREELTPDFGQPRFDMMTAIASAIRAAGAEKTAESGHSPSTHNLASE